MIHYLTLKSREKTELIDITARVEEIIAASRINSGCCDVFVLHTTAAVTVNEGADPAVKRDISNCLDRMVPDAHYFTHAEGNSAAHVKASMIGCSERLMVDRSKLLLGTWQALYFCEFDGPRERRVAVKLCGE
ncbi:secondary thiamine-phosphate synthase enzyme [Geoanaerobacter pelophilus]|uniref:Secondary thiamine-phosphate synthase enzyme n=1 Tax=Geoanaerobacter pelophilus TaxID=60036 RepID=A0ABQ0MKX2_9BACT|nr:secondary thiamine-phosphate synthase enzyme YjbQ [Geoanaerobacter pelophilus]GAW67689.1 secondary thiamine-phosphate synthase enzyme [Geoanaerobacter pelophilus]